MDINFYKTKNYVKILCSALVLAALAPSVSFAALGVNLKTAAGISMGANFCTNLTTYSANLSNKLSTAETNLNGLQQTILTNAQNRQTTRAQDLANIRNQNAQNRQAIYIKLNAEATTDAEKAAVATFQTTIEAAVTSREGAVDAAISSYWTGVFNVISTRQAAVKTAEQNYASAMQAAVSTAQTSCSAGTAAVTVRAAFSSSAVAARTQFATDRQAIDKSGPQIKALGQTRNAAVAQAFTTFDAQAKAAGAALKATFAVSATATTTAQ